MSRRFLDTLPTARKDQGATSLHTPDLQASEKGTAWRHSGLPLEDPALSRSPCTRRPALPSSDPSSSSPTPSSPSRASIHPHPRAPGRGVLQLAGLKRQSTPEGVTAEPPEGVTQTALTSSCSGSRVAPAAVQQPWGRGRAEVCAWTQCTQGGPRRANGAPAHAVTGDQGPEARTPNAHPGHACPVSWPSLASVSPSVN